jgi:Mor family transcriptional regulator
MISTLAEIADYVGPSTADWLCQNYPGQRIRIPCTIPKAHSLARSPDADKLSYYFGGIRLRIPARSWQEVLARDLQIYADYRSGNSMSELARAYSISVRGVRRSLARAEAK